MQTAIAISEDRENELCIMLLPKRERKKESTNCTLDKRCGFFSAPKVTKKSGKTDVDTWHRLVKQRGGILSPAVRRASC